MNWSVSKAKQFQSCQRKWFFSDILAQWNAKKEPIKREAYILKNLQSIQAWRGSLVDTVIEKKVLLPIMFQGITPTENIVINYAMDIADKQIEFGKQKKYREEGMTKTKAGDSFAAFYDIEYKGVIDNEKLEYAKNEIKIALHNFFISPIFQKLLKPNTNLLVQRDLKFPYNGFTVNAKPDLVIFRDNQPPHIIDWKVHDNRYTDYWQQLTVYSYVLSKIAQTKPHKDFPSQFIKDVPRPHRYSITEYQLLKGISKEYSIAEQDIEDVEDLIHITGEWMQDIYEDRNLINAKDCQTTSYPQSCVNCGFKKLCQEVENHDQK